MKLETERMCHAGHPRPPEGEGFGPLFQQGFCLNYLHGLDFLCRRHIEKEDRVLEVGCFYGVSSELFRSHSNFLTCVDIELYPEMEERISRLGISFVKSDSMKFLSEIEVGKFDFIYIDTTHDFGQTKSEIILSYSKLKTGQRLAGHDFNSPGVFNAIYDVFVYPDIEIYLDSSWVIQKTGRLVLK